MLKLVLLMCGVCQSIGLSHKGASTSTGLIVINVNGDHVPLNIAVNYSSSVCYQLCKSTSGYASCLCSTNVSDCCYHDINHCPGIAFDNLTQVHYSNGEIYICMYNTTCQDPDYSGLETATSSTSECDCDKVIRPHSITIKPTLISLPPCL